MPAVTAPTAFVLGVTDAPAPRRCRVLYAGARRAYTGRRNVRIATREEAFVLHGNIHRHLLILSIANWVIAILSWSISAYLGIAVPTSIFIYSVLFVIGLFAVVVAVVSYVLADFGAEPEAVVAAGAPAEPAAAGEPATPNAG